MEFRHAAEIWAEFPELAAGVVFADGVDASADVTARAEPFEQIARERLAAGTESDLPEIQAWRRAYSRMGLKPTQYRCASEALLRRFRKEGSLPRIHPVIDLCNAISLAYAIPVAALDTSKIATPLEVRRATGEENYETFGGEIEHPEPGEVIFADTAGNAHARRWTNRQSGASAVRESTTSVLVVAEALHETAAADIARLTATVSEELATLWPVDPTSALLSASSRSFAFGS